MRVKTECDRDDSRLLAVAAVARATRARSSSPTTSSSLSTSCTCRFVTCHRPAPPPPSPRTHAAAAAAIEGFNPESQTSRGHSVIGADRGAARGSPWLHTYSRETAAAVADSDEADEEIGSP